MEEEMLKRWRLILGGDEADGTGVTLNMEEQRMDSSLQAVYDSDKRGGLGSSAPKVSRWLGDIREFFPQTVVQVIQRDAIKRLNLTSLLTEKEMLETVVPDVHLVATLMSLSRVIPEKNKEMARQVVRQVVDELLRKLSAPMQQAVTGALNRSSRRRNPRYNEIDWKTTIQRNLKNYQPEYKTVIPEIRIGYGRKRRALKDVILCLDQPDTLVAVKKDSPLIVGVAPHGHFIASDVPAVLKYTNRVYYLDDKEIAVLRESRVRFLNLDQEPLQKPLETITWSPDSADFIRNINRKYQAGKNWMGHYRLS